MGASEQGASQTAGRWLVIPRTLCFILNGDDVLLMKRAAHKRVFPNRYNGVGGHIERDEDPLTSARREIHEETGLVVCDLRLRAIYNVDAGDETGIGVLVFTAVSAQRVTVESDEGTLHWIPRDEVLNYDLVEDLPLILPRILRMGTGDAPLFVHMGYDDSDQMQLTIAGD
jgi:8-oxo-dGTP diphosphatase